jgi:hypothetical protein
MQGTLSEEDRRAIMTLCGAFSNNPDALDQMVAEDWQDIPLGPAGRTTSPVASPTSTWCSTRPAATPRCNPYDTLRSGGVLVTIVFPPDQALAEAPDVTAVPSSTPRANAASEEQP